MDVIYKNVGSNETFAQNLKGTLALTGYNFQSYHKCIGMIRNEIDNGIFIFLADTRNTPSDHQIVYYNYLVYCEYSLYIIFIHTFI